MRTRRSFTDEFKRDAVALVVDEDRKIVDVADSLGVGEGTLGNWARGTTRSGCGLGQSDGALVHDCRL